MSYDEYTVDELLEAATELNDRADALFARLARIECTAHGEGITATVNLEGRLVDLTLSAQAVALRPDELAAEVFRLTQEASATALAEGLDALAPLAGEELTAQIRALTAAGPQPTGPASRERIDELPTGPAHDFAPTTEPDAPPAGERTTAAGHDVVEGTAPAAGPKPPSAGGLPAEPATAAAGGAPEGSTRGPRTLDDLEDFSSVETWALPH